MLGLSNISFGLNPAARHVLNSVFLDHAIQRGLTGAIVHATQQDHAAAQDPGRGGRDRRGPDLRPPAKRVTTRCRPSWRSSRAAAARPARRRARAEDVETRLKDRIIDGDRQGLEDDLAEALEKHPPLDIINVHLLDGMKVVGELFGAGKMQLPFVLQSAETMKAAVAYLEPHMDKVDGQDKGTVVLATVKGDVHDIGKNLVDIILTNNGYNVVNLGIKQPIEQHPVAAAEEHERRCDRHERASWSSPPSMMKRQHGAR